MMMRWLIIVLAFVSLTMASLIIGCRGSVDRLYDDAVLGSSGGGGADPAKPDDGGSGGGGAVEAGPSAPAKIGGTVIGLVGSGLVLQNNAGDDLTITTGGAFVFTTPIAPNLPYAVTVRSQPKTPTQTCTIANGTGTAKGIDVIDVRVTCTTDAYKVGGSVVGLVGTGLVLQNNGGNDLPVMADGTFTFTQPVPSGANFNVTLKTQPLSPVQTCSVSGATGTVVTADVTSVVVNCGTNTYTIGGNVSGLAGTLVLKNGAATRTITANGSYAFATPIASGGSYNVSVSTQPTYPPAAQTCSVSNGSGSVGSVNIANIDVVCTTASFTVGGNVTGLTSTGLVLQNNNGNNLSVGASGPFTFTASVSSGSPYNVTILTQPSADKCVVNAGSGSGTVTNSKVSSVSITCSPLIVLSENFDGVTAPALPNGWSSNVVTGGAGDNPWETEAFNANSAPNAAHVHDEGHVTDIVLTSPPMTIASSTAQLSFWNSFETEYPWDGGILEISIAGAPFADIIKTGGAFVAGGYSRSLRIDSQNPIAGEPAWVGGDTFTTIVNLPATAAGKSIVLRWRMCSDEGAGAPGWRIDNVVVSN